MSAISMVAISMVAISIFCFWPPLPRLRSPHLQCGRLVACYDTGSHALKMRASDGDAGEWDTVAESENDVRRVTLHSYGYLRNLGVPTYHHY